MSDWLKTIVLATDGSEDAALAAQAAGSLASRTGASLHIVHAWYPIYPMAYPYPLPESYLTEYEDAARATLTEAVEQVKQQNGVEVETHLVMGRPADEIVEQAQKLGADLLVLGSRGMGPIERLVIGSVAESVLHHAPCPVLAMRGGEPAWPPAQVTIGDDGSPEALQAMELAARIGQTFGVASVLVRAIPELVVPPQMEEFDDPKLRQEAVQKVEQALAERASALAARLGQRPETRVAISDSAALILDVAAKGPQPALIAVGHRGLGLFKRLRLGSTATRVWRAAHSPILISGPHPEPKA